MTWIDTLAISIMFIGVGYGLDCIIDRLKRIEDKLNKL